MSERRGAVRVLVVLGTPFLYGLERAVIDRFDSTRPELQPLFLLAHASKRKDLPILAEVRKRALRHTFFSDRWDWPRFGRPRSLGHALQVMIALLLGNLDVVRASWGKDAIYVPNRFGLIQAVLAAMLLRLRGRQIVYEFHDQPTGPLLSLRLLHPLVTDFVTGSEYCYDGVRSHYPYIPDTKLRLIRQAVRDSCAKERETAVRLDPSQRHIIFIGQLREDKGPLLLLEAFSILADEYPDAHLHFVGEGAKEYEEIVRARIGDLGLGERVTLWGYRADARALLGRAYVLVQPTRPSMFRESFGRSVVEAMVESVPGVVLASGGLTESVIHGETGLVCREESAACLADNLRLLLADPQLRNQYGRAARRRYERLLVPAVVRPVWLDLFHRRDGRTARDS